MNFGQALQAIKDNKCIARAGWNGKGMHLYLEDMLSYTIVEGAFKGTRRKYEPCVVMFTAVGGHQPGWTPSQPDLFAEDWVIVEIE